MDKKYLGFVVRGLLCYAENNRHTSQIQGTQFCLFFFFLDLPTETTPLLKSLRNVHHIKLDITHLLEKAKARYTLCFETFKLTIKT